MTKDEQPNGPSTGQPSPQSRGAAGAVETVMEHLQAARQAATDEGAQRTAAYIQRAIEAQLAHTKQRTELDQ